LEKKKFQAFEFIHKRKVTISRKGVMRLRPLQSRGSCTVTYRKLKVRLRPLQSRASHTVTCRKLKVRLRPLQSRGSCTVTCWKSWDRDLVSQRVIYEEDLKNLGPIPKGRSLFEKRLKFVRPTSRRGSLFEKDLKLGLTNLDERISIWKR